MVIGDPWPAILRRTCIRTPLCCREPPGPFITVKVTDGRLDIAFEAVTGTTLVNSVRVTQRPDLTS